MKKLFILFAFVFAFVFVVGCEQPSMNIQRSASRDVGDTGVTIFLEKCDVEKIEAKKNDILKILNEIETLINTGMVGDLTVGKAKSEITKIVPQEYNGLAGSVLDYLAGFEVPTDKIPVKIIKNIKAVILGMKNGVAEYKIEDRKPKN